MTLHKRISEFAQVLPLDVDFTLRPRVEYLRFGIGLSPLQLAKAIGMCAVSSQ